MVLDSLVGELSSWLRHAHDVRRSQRDRHAAFVLHDASLLFAAMLAYDNSSRRAYRRAMLYAQPSADSDDALVKEARHQAYQGLVSFEEHHELYHYVEQATASLLSKSNDCTLSDERIMLIRLVQSGRRFNSEVSRPVLNAKERQRQAELLGDTPQVGRDLAADRQSEAVEDYARNMLKTVEELPALVADTRDAYADLRDVLITRYALPPPPAVSAL